MMKKFDQIKFVKKITSQSSRQLGVETKTAEEIMDILKVAGLEFSIQRYYNYIPFEKEVFLEADGQKINCQNSGFVSGKIDGNYKVVDSLSDCEVNTPNINFNSKCKGISLSSFYNIPSLAIASTDLKKVIKAEKVNGYTKVEKIKHESLNIIVGNKQNPQNIYFTHFDSIGSGAIDNAGGVAVILEIL